MDTTEQLHFHFSLSCIGEGNGNPLQCSCLENPRDWGAWWATVYGIAQSWTRMKRLSSSSIYIYIYTPKVVEWKNMVGKWFLTLKNNFLLPRVLITFVMLGVSDCGNQIIGIVVLKKKKKGLEGEVCQLTFNISDYNIRI